MVQRGAIGVIVRDDGHFLVIQRSEWVRAPGKLCFPGGGIEGDETEQEAVVRELKEELDLDVNPIRRLWRSLSPTQVDLVWWLTELVRVDQIPQPNPQEVAQCTWMSHHAMLEASTLLESNRRFLRAIEAGEIVLGM